MQALKVPRLLFKFSARFPSLYTAPRSYPLPQCQAIQKPSYSRTGTKLYFYRLLLIVPLDGN